MKYDPKIKIAISKAVNVALLSLSNEQLSKMSWFSTVEEKKQKNLRLKG